MVEAIGSGVYSFSFSLLFNQVGFGCVELNVIFSAVPFSTPFGEQHSFPVDSLVSGCSSEPSAGQNILEHLNT